MKLSFLPVATCLATSLIPAAAQNNHLIGTPKSSKYQQQQPDNDLKQLLKEIDQSRLQATVQRLVSFGTRHTGSSQTDPVRGIGAATAWVFSQFQSYAATSGGHMTVQQQSFVQTVSPNIPVPTTITNVIATLTGSVSPNRTYVILAHLDSRVSDNLDFTSDAPGADDNASGVAVVLELARVMATRVPNATIMFATVAGEEQGLYGSTFMANQLAAAGVDVEGVFNIDTVGSSTAQDGSQDPSEIRLFTEGVPSAATPLAISLLKAAGGEDDSASRELGRFAKSVGENGQTSIDNVWVIKRRDRYLRGSDQISFQVQGFPAARYTEPNENFDHQHQNVQIVNGVQFGDLVAFLDFPYLARAAAVSAASLWSLTEAPGTPKNLQLSVGSTPPNSTNLSWNQGTDPGLAGYEVVWREMDDPDWTHIVPVGNVTSASFPFFAKDNFIIGVRAVDGNGHHSPVAFPALSN
jgi:hypothetical protein